MTKRVFHICHPVVVEYSDGELPEAYLEQPVVDCGPEGWGSQYDPCLSVRSGQEIAVLDLGANVGLFYDFVRALWGDTVVRYYGLEPHPETYEQILNPRIGSDRRVRLFNAAAYPNSSGTVILFGGLAGSAKAFISGHQVGQSHRDSEDRWFEVKSIHPKDLPPADVVKVDVEGSEGEIIVELDLSETSVVCVEMHGAENAEVVSRTLLDAGFVVRKARNCPTPFNVEAVFIHPGRVWGKFEDARA